MKFLAAVLATILVAQLTAAVAIDHPLYDLLKAYEHQEAFESNNQELATEDIPIASRDCGFAACDNACKRLGCRYGRCISPTTCRCYC